MDTFQTAFRVGMRVDVIFCRLGSGAFRIYFVKMVARERKDFGLGLFLCQADSEQPQAENMLSIESEKLA